MPETTGEASLARSARAVGGWSWAERQLFEVVGQWVPSCSSPILKVYLATVSQHHGWRAGLWEGELGGRLVQAYAGPGPLPSDLHLPPTAVASRLMAALAELEGDVARLAVHQRVVLTRCLTEYRAWAQRLSPLRDGPVARCLALVESDTRADWDAAGPVLAVLMDNEGPAAAAAACARLDALMVGAAYVFGPCPGTTGNLGSISH